MTASFCYLDQEDRMTLSIHRNSIQNNLDNIPIHYFTTGKQKLFFKNVLVFCSIFPNEADKEGVEYRNLFKGRYRISKEIFFIKLVLIY